MTYPQAIYTWENSDEKILPTLDHLVALAKLYKISIDEMIVIREDDEPSLSVNEPHSSYRIAKDIIDYINCCSSQNTRTALKK